MKGKLVKNMLVDIKKISMLLLVALLVCAYTAVDMAEEAKEADNKIGFVDIISKDKTSIDIMKAQVDKLIAEAESKKKPKHVWTFNATRSVTRGDKEKKAVSLTFDDGLDSKSVEKVLKVLNKYEVKGTFFVIGKAIRQKPELWKQAAADGHQICNHTQTHALLGGLSEEQVKKEIRDWEETVKEVLGEAYFSRMKAEFPFIRLPGGSGEKSKKLMNIIAGEKYIPVGWSVETIHSVLGQYDKKKNSVETISQFIANHVVGSAQNGAIILLHFNPYDTTKLEYIVKTILERGKTIDPVSEILKSE